MIGKLFGVGTTASQLREGLGETSANLRTVAHRVANATNGVAPGAPGFDEALAGADPGRAAQTEEVDLETEMVRLANEQIRYDTSATLLQRVYQQLRLSVGGV